MRWLVWLVPLLLFSTSCGPSSPHDSPPLPTEDGDLSTDLDHPNALGTSSATRDQISKNRVRAGETLSQILTDAGVDASRTRQAAHLLQQHMDVHRIPAQSAYTVCRDKSGDLRSLVFHVSPFQDVTLEMDAGMRARVDRKEARLITRKAQGIVSRSLHQTLVADGHPAALAAALQAIFGQRINFRRMPRGARFQVLYREHQVEGRAVGLERILGARIRHRGKVLQAFLHDSAGPHYYDEKGMPLKGGSLFAPVKASRISSPYSRNRFHPILKRSMPHLGTDYAAPYGSSVVAVADGIVVAARHARYNGNYVKIAHDRVYQTQYLHLSSFPKKMYEGKRVKQGETIGFVGDTGLADGTHLCFRLWKNGRQVDPQLHQLAFGAAKVAGPSFQSVAAAIAKSLGPFPDAEHPHQTRSGSPAEG